eukprot:2889116-Amphidinium_carterae.1
MSDAPGCRLDMAAGTANPLENIYVLPCHLGQACENSKDNNTKSVKVMRVFCSMLCMLHRRRRFSCKFPPRGVCRDLNHASPKRGCLRRPLQPHASLQWGVCQDLDHLASRQRKPSGAGQ